MSAGAPKKYSDKQLKDTLAKHMAKNPGEKINPSILERETGISRFVWSRRLGNEIKKINQPIEQEFFTSGNSLPLPNVVELIETYWNNKTGLITALNHYNDMLQTLFEKANQYKETIRLNQELNRLLKDRDFKINELNKEIKHIQKQYMEIAVKGSYRMFQDKDNLENVITITKNKKSKERALSTDYIKNFPELFDHE